MVKAFVCEGDEVIIFDSHNTAETLASSANSISYESTDPQDEYLGQFPICPGGCVNFGGNVFCGEGFYSYADIDIDGCEIEISLDLIIFQYPPQIINISGGDLITCDQPCVSLDVLAIDADFYFWPGTGENLGGGFRILKAGRSAGTSWNEWIVIRVYRSDTRPSLWFATV